MIPGDILSPRETSGLRIGFAAVTTRGCDNLAARIIAELIHKYLKEEISKEDALKEVKKLTSSWKLIEEI
jgi:glycine hydroxymethyltransferase